MKISAISPWLALAVAAIGLTACASSTTPPEADTDSPAASYVRTSDWGEGDAALLEGTVTLENSCLTVVDDAGQIIVPVFPTDFAWDADAGEITGFGHTFSVGEPASMGGGYHDAPPSSAEYIPSGCEGGAQYFMVYSA
ncbi:hypothetical protein [Georgenia satyanarayanai]|uniref:hypothetical protein n=1 Tax=Georgenia satyanarayanai TaxID=860221 RepID=UPI0012646285|nr:hypothetical protein [Georgenia satyanarayanai]